MKIFSIVLALVLVNESLASKCPSNTTIKIACKRAYYKCKKNAPYAGGCKNNFDFCFSKCTGGEKSCAEKCSAEYDLCLDKPDGPKDSCKATKKQCMAGVENKPRYCSRETLDRLGKMCTVACVIPNFSWGLIGAVLAVPASLADRYNYSEDVLAKPRSVCRSLCRIDDCDCNTFSF